MQKLFWRSLAKLTLVFACVIMFVGALALLNKRVPVDPLLDQIGVMVAIIYIAIGAVILRIYRGFQRAESQDNDVWTRFARAAKENW